MTKIYKSFEEYLDANPKLKEKYGMCMSTWNYDDLVKWSEENYYLTEVDLRNMWKTKDEEIDELKKRLSILEENTKDIKFFSIKKIE
jgi:hypothetical protein